MAWTTPRTWTTGEIVTAGNMNTHVRDNLLEAAAAKVTTAGDSVYATAANALARVAQGAITGGVGNPKYVLKTADETVNNSTTLQNDDHLLLALAANEIWLIEAILILQTENASDFKYEFTVPAAGVSASSMSVHRHTGGTIVQTGTPSSTDAFTSVANPWVLPIFFYVANGANAGNFQLQWAQVAAAVEDTKVKKGSYLRCFKVA